MFPYIGPEVVSCLLGWDRPPGGSDHGVAKIRKSLKNRVVLITGASSGIGAAIAIEAARRGATSILASRNGDKLQQVENFIRAHDGAAKSYVTDVTVAANCENLRACVEGEFSTPDIIINNAGTGRWSYLEETSCHSIDEMIDAPLRAAAYVTRAFLPGMMVRGTGAVGNVSSIACYLPWSGATGYTATRWAMRGFNEALRADFRGTRLSATLLACSTVDTEYFKKNKTRVPAASGFIPVLKADHVARQFLDAIAARKPVLILPPGMDLLRKMSFFFPAFVAGMVDKAAGKAREAIAHTGNNGFRPEAPETLSDGPELLL
jgi:uncharacterized protein